ncbi:MAG: hypothetical protein BWY07_02685 [Candidatus Hydrogenedentes bacterium ADurb.Bin170]|nr:MAG: hypothetical protein BWY07_02685 [Candidatus Hydrogenedentes bacterium ADurb.Bin170]
MLVFKRIEGDVIHHESTGVNGLLRHLCDYGDYRFAHGRVDPDRYICFPDIVKSLRDFFESARHTHHFVMLLAVAVETYQKIADACLAETFCPAGLRQLQPVCDQRRVQSDIPAMRYQRQDLLENGRLSALDIHRPVAVEIAQPVHDLFCLIQLHESVERVAVIFNTADEITEIAALVACLTEPDHTPPGIDTLFCFFYSDHSFSFLSRKFSIKITGSLTWWQRCGGRAAILR